MTAQKVSPIPEGMRSITPHLVCDGAADAIEFYKKAFGAVEHGRMPGPDGKLIHALISIGDSKLMLVDSNPAWGAFGPDKGRASPVTIHLYVEDADKVFAQAVEHGATSRMPVAEMFWGDRYGTLTDPFGHSWSVATHVRELSSEEIASAATQGCAPEQA
jgi:PhnB protein